MNRLLGIKLLLKMLVLGSAAFLEAAKPKPAVTDHLSRQSSLSTERRGPVMRIGKEGIFAHE
jgi:hypothetical protein